MREGVRRGVERGRQKEAHSPALDESEQGGGHFKRFEGKAKSERKTE